ncbi:hypothetical protein POM88_008875 [Heracleum sosnowskyi]|uniref:F-box associated beta-propeller type 3 domain-containing protein n=1 Tax=Heracleum sosnowskyi TaxID=360622 RepID=A0AAD8JAV1_9APIA|nr:hypothetical protein POM88_008875 [Heracleum sosnowskyi]
MAKSLCDVPEGLLTEIFVRIPVKSLLQCKSVCKPLLSNPHFVKSHLHRTLISYWNNPTLLTILNPPPSEAGLALLALMKADFLLAQSIFMTHQVQRQEELMNQALLDTSGQDLSKSPVDFYRLVMPPCFDSDCRVISSFNGIICLANLFGNVVYLWNPTIRQCRKILGPTEHTGRIFSVKMGFGYISESNEYIVLRLLFDVIPIVQVYSTKTDSWKEFRAPTLQNWKDCSGAQIVVNGILYFDGVNELVSFDLRNEVIGLVPFPTIIQTKKSDVLDFEGSVAMVFESGSGFDLWTLDDVSGQVSWTKFFSIENDSETEIWLQSYLGAGQFYGRKIYNERYYMYRILYDYEKKEIKYHGLGEENINVNLKYTQSLVSLDGFEQME